MTNRAQRLKNVQAFHEMLSFLMANPGTSIQPINGMAKFTKVKPERGKWYFMTTCPQCGSDLAFFEDPSRGALGNPFSGSGAFQSPCYKCRTDIVTILPMIRTQQWTI